MLSERVARGAEARADAAHIGGMVDVACLDMLEYVALLFAHVSAVEASPALLALPR